MLRNSKIPKSVWILGLISLFTDFASEMLYPVTPLFLAALGASMSVIGLIEGLAEITAGILKGFFGILSDKINKRAIFVKIGYTLSGLVKPLPGLFPSIAAIVSSRITDRIGKGIRSVPRDALLAGASKENSGAIFGFHRGMDTLGAVVGPITALILLNFFPADYVLIYLLAIVPSVAAIIFALNVKEKNIESSVKKNNYQLKSFWSNASKEYKILLIILVLFSLVNSSDVFLILKTESVVDSDVYAILGYVFYNIIYAASSYKIGGLSDRFGKKKIFTVGMFVFSLVYLGFALSESFLLILLLFGLYGLYASSTEGISKAWISDIVPSHFHGTAIGLVTTLSSIGVMIGSVLAGFLWDRFGSTIPFLLSSIVSFILVLLLLIMKNESE
jgi:MFS family permease